MGSGRELPPLYSGLKPPLEFLPVHCWQAERDPWCSCLGQLWFTPVLLRGSQGLGTSPQMTRNSSLDLATLIPLKQNTKAWAAALYLLFFLFFFLNSNFSAYNFICLLLKIHSFFFDSVTFLIFLIQLLKRLSSKSLWNETNSTFFSNDLLHKKILQGMFLLYDFFVIPIYSNN